MSLAAVSGLMTMARKCESPAFCPLGDVRVLVHMLPAVDGGSGEIQKGYSVSPRRCLLL